MRLIDYVPKPLRHFALLAPGIAFYVLAAIAGMSGLHWGFVLAAAGFAGTFCASMKYEAERAGVWE